MKQFDDVKDADFLFVFGDKALLAHKWILQARVPYFQSMFSSGMVESIASRVEIKDADVESFKVVLKFIYSGRLPKVQNSMILG